MSRHDPALARAARAAQPESATPAWLAAYYAPERARPRPEAGRALEALEQMYAYADT